MTTSIRPESVPEPESNSQITTPAEEPAGAMTFFEHLSELRKRIIYSLYAIGVGAFIGVYVSKYFINWITKPMLDALRGAHLDHNLVYTHPAGYLNLVITLGVYLGLVLASPIVIFFLSLFGIVTPRFLWKNFRYAILIIAIVAAIVTPTPDAMTMLIFMAPMVGLYFVGIAVSAVVTRRRERRLATAVEAR